MTGFQCEASWIQGGREVAAQVSCQNLLSIRPALQHPFQHLANKNKNSYSLILTPRTIPRSPTHPSVTVMAFLQLHSFFMNGQCCKASDFQKFKTSQYWACCHTHTFIMYMFTSMLCQFALPVCLI